MITLETIKAFFDNYKFDNNVLILNKCTKITNVERFVKVNIKLLESNSGNKCYRPYASRLKKVYLKIKQNEDNT